MQAPLEVSFCGKLTRKFSGVSQTGPSGGLASVIASSFRPGRHRRLMRVIFPPERAAFRGFSGFAWTHILPGNDGGPPTPDAFFGAREGRPSGDFLNLQADLLVGRSNSLLEASNSLPDSGRKWLTSVRQSYRPAAPPRATGIQAWLLGSRARPPQAPRYLNSWKEQAHQERRMPAERREARRQLTRELAGTALRAGGYF
ncbi:hypothetical protein Bbelb_384990 [Branchiostoma belcheri]|nr:hypothetical protein Bbelb_384990 [Branchiostoma belcheri]